jgi:hypothetical protein
MPRRTRRSNPVSVQVTNEACRATKRSTASSLAMLSSNTVVSEERRRFIDDGETTMGTEHQIKSFKGRGRRTSDGVARGRIAEAPTSAWRFVDRARSLGAGGNWRVEFLTRFAKS